MQKTLANILFSTRLTGTLFIVYAIAMITGTFLDAGQETSPTPFTRHYIYNAWWFETIMVLFVINFVGNIFRYRLLRKEKWATLILHLAFIFIFIGAGITRYIGYEGWMPIREGETENTFLTRDIYLTAFIDGDLVVNGQQQRRVIQERVDFSERLDNDLELHTEYNGTPVSIKVKQFVKDAELDIIADDAGESYLKLVEAGDEASHSHYIKDGDDELIHNVVFTLNNPKKGAINITTEGDKLFIESPFGGDYLTMATQASGTLVKDSIQPLMLRSRYQIGNMAMVFPKPVVKGTFGVVKKSALLTSREDGVVADVTVNGETKTVNLLGGQYVNGRFEQIKVGGLDVAVKYGSIVKELPFSIKLNDFRAERYPGTQDNFSAFSSDITVIKPNETPYDYKIFMNHVLDEEGYRFFQASFFPDEKGTKLSVNHDQWGTYVTYFGYMLLYFGLMAILFSKGTRFADLKKMLEKVKIKKAKLLGVFLLGFGMFGFAQEHSEDDGHNHAPVQQEHFEGDGHNHTATKIERPTKAQIDSVIRANITPKAHADKFGELVIQDYSGRMMPMNTYASEVLRKLSKMDHYEEFDANQVLLSMQESPLFWYNVPIIYLAKRKGDSIRSIIGVSKDQKYVSITDFLTDDGRNKLGPYLEEAYAAEVPNGFQKEFKEAYDRMSLLFNTLDGRSIKIFPVPDDEKNTWISPVEYKESYRDVIKDTIYGKVIENSFRFYLGELYKAKQTGDYDLANRLLGGFKNNQSKIGSEVMLSDDKIKTEILYNKYDIFKKLYSWYMYAGALLFVLIIVQIFSSKNKWVDVAVKGLGVVIFGLFLLHTAGLIVRWYISGHAPWSDAYESMIYVAWATMLFGLLLSNSAGKSPMSIVSNVLKGKNKSYLTTAAGAFVTAMILMVAHWNWMDPAIANLSPVLDSYWLMIHVAVIVASYGPFALGMILGITVLLLMIFTTEDNKAKMALNIKELTIINEMALTVGLVMLTIGNFLGGMWANESWGRYWGWDPKETWALISIMVYAFVIHMRLIPGLRGRYGFNLASIIAFGSILFTYFGVNFYLSGLHSYQSGQQILSYQYIAITLGFITLLGFFARLKYKKYYKK
ncbi:cytochrome c biogenesis protein CcsA [Psychroserpens sp. SPM9]|uniref:cytochrome c biogenesis protein CcsA n=1 Tax=Psychroserpens sp. SPM9 TaxID=2975598 RepID=UPI0021A8DCAC|nr:cytochrome c biogenesis protein CcsA [Psychroserpens sp. SPM9]MDG5493169.1 cytochrome c biogenesis protein CcsA [Psychroserpens sp. SPM9]